MKVFLKKFLVISLVAAFAAAPFSAFAQIPGASRVPIQLDGEGILGGIGDTVTGTAGTACVTADTVANQITNALSQGLSFLGDSPALVTNLQAQAGIVDAAITCWSGIVTDSSLPNTTLFGFSRSNAQREQALSQIAALKQTKKQLEARIQVASQGFWKAVLVGLLLKQTDSITERLVSQLTEKFKINNYANYISAIADTVYVNDMIVRNVDNDRDRAIVRSIITNPILKTKIHPVIQAAANEYVGFDASSLRYDDPELMAKIVRLQGRQEYAEQYQSQMVTKVDEVIAKAREAAVTEVQQGQGYKSTLNNCGPSISAQKQKDLEYAAILKEIEDRTALQSKIQTSPTATPTEKQQIDTDVKTATSKLSTLGNIALHICEGVNTPSQKFKDSIHDLISSRIKGFSDYNDNNLPFFQKLVVSIGDNLINKFIFSGNVSKGDLIDEANRAISGIANTIPKPSSQPTTPSTTGFEDKVQITAASTAAPGTPVSALIPGREYIITVNFTGISSQNPVKVEADGASSGSINRDLTAAERSAGKITFTHAANGAPLNLSVRFYKSFDAVSVLLIEQYSKSFPIAQVSGAVTGPFEPRGPMIPIRGN